MFGGVVVEGDVRWSCSGGRCWEMVRRRTLFGGVVVEGDVWWSCSGGRCLVEL